MPVTVVVPLAATVSLAFVVARVPTIVVVPLALPGLVSTGVFAFNHAWNEFLFALVFTSSEKNKVLTMGLATWIGQDAIFSWGMLLSAAVLVTIPVMLFYLLVQKQLVVGLTSGGTKGE